jgi:hypothetical protein
MGGGCLLEVAMTDVVPAGMQMAAHIALVGSVGEGLEVGADAGME